MFTWKSSIQMVHWIRPVFLVLSIFTSQDLSWLQNGQLNCVSNASKFFLLGGGPRFDFRRPIFQLKLKNFFEKKWRRPKTTQKKSREAFCWCYLGLSKQCQRSLIRSIHRCLQQWIVDVCGSTFSMKALKQPISINP